MSITAMRVVTVSLDFTVAQAVPVETLLIAIITSSIGITISRVLFIPGALYLLGLLVMLGYPDHCAMLFTVIDLVVVSVLAAIWMWRPMQAVPADPFAAADPDDALGSVRLSGRSRRVSR